MFRIVFAGILAILILLPVSARADYFVWRDPDTGLSLSFPDTWRVVSNAQDGDLVTIMPPSGRGNAVCRVSSGIDRRTVIYPPRYADEIQKINYSNEFWDSYLKRYNNPEIYNVQNGAGLGRGFAGYAEAGYQSAVPGPEMNRKALMFASLYNDTLYVLECSSHRDAFDGWKGSFLSIAKSVDFKKAHYEVTTGYYRDFLEDPHIAFPGEEGENVVFY